MFSRSARLYDAVYGFKDYDAEAEVLRALIDARMPDARTLLDVACGTGKHLERLRAWYDVEGLDLDAPLLAVARERLPGVPLHERDMVDFELERTFDVVACLFSSIGYVRTTGRLRQAVAAMARHVVPRGLVVVEPWLTPDVWDPDHVHAVVVDEPERKIVRMNSGAPLLDGTSTIEFHYLVGTPAGVEHFTEPHTLGVFTHDDYLEAFRDSGLEVEHDPQGLMGRGLYVGRRGA